jgi:uncharacterized protein YyaL (SSP411 family)
MPAIDWRPWTADAFARARAERRPVLLSITAAWCGCCDEMDRSSYADPEVAALVNTRFVAVRVDADRRPDISDRYSLGGWPTTAFLTPDGAIVGGGTYVPRDRILGVLSRLADAFATREDEMRALATAAVDSTHPPRAPLSLDGLLDGIFHTYDSEHGGFGAAPKFPLTAPIHLALDLYAESGEARFAEIALRTLDAIGWGELYDVVDDGFFRCAAASDWRDPHREKLLDVNAKLLAVFLHGARVLGVTRFEERAAGVLRYVQTWLADHVDGAWAGSQGDDAAYYALVDAADRRGLPPPRIDAALYADWNAQMASAALGAAAVLDDEGLREFAVKSLERVVLACYRPGGGVAHYVLDGRAEVRGLLDDQISMATAHLDAHLATGNIVYEMMAEELAHYAVASLWEHAAGGFYDRAEEPDAVGLLKRRVKPFVGNCDAARMLKRLSVVSGNSEFARIAEAAIDAVAPAAPEHGPLAAHLALAMREPSLR